MNEEWLIDGWNLLHACRPSGRQAKIQSKETLCGKLAEFASAKGCRVTVFFDGVGNDEEFGSYRTDRFEAFYSQRVSADAKIERRLFEGRGKASFVVVTNDRAVGDIAAGNGARVLGASRFLEEWGDCRKEGDEDRFRRDTRSHGFNRPFEDKL